MRISLLKKSFKVFVLLLFTNLSFGQVTLPHYDGFNYGVSSTLKTQTSWAEVGTTGDDILVSTGNLNYFGLPISTGNKIAFGGGGIDAAKAFTTQTAGFGTIYMSFILNISTLGSLNNTGGYCVSFADGASNFASTLWVRAATGGYNIGLAPRTTTATVQWSSEVRTINTNYLIVLSLNSVTGVLNDVSRLWINPALGTAEPAALFAITNPGATADLTTVNRILIRQDSTTATPQTIELDEFRIGLTWESVTPALPTWNGTIWSNVTGPTLVTDALIDGSYSTLSSGNFSSKNLIVSNAGSLTISSGTSITVAENITNNATAAALVVQNNGNIIQQGTANNNIGNITVNRNSTPMIRLDYTFWGSPVAGQNLFGFSPATLTDRFYDYDENANNFTNVGLPTNFVTGKGYSVRAPNTFNNTPAIFAGAFVGVPNNGNVSVNVFNTGGPKGYNILGNPYPSPISAVDFLAANTNVSTLYYWTHFAQGAAANANYATFNGTGSAAVAGGVAPNNFIQTGQGFIAKVLSTGTVNFTNAMRVSNFDNQFFRTAVIANSIAEKNRIWLNLSNTNGVLNQALVGYVSNATNGLDTQYDGSLLEIEGTKLYSVLNNDAFTIQGKAVPFTNTDTVALGFKTDVAGNYTITIAQLDGLFTGNQDVFLRDNQLGITNNLKLGNYSFASDVGTFNARFSIVYQNVLNVNSPIFDANSVTVFAKDNMLNINSGATAMNSVEVFDIRGSLLFTKNSIASNEISINNLTVSNGVLIVKIRSIDGNTVTKKILF